jgi:hypothetical protein
MLATYGSALLIVIASLYVGRAFFALLGKRETNWLETPVGFALLLVVCSVTTRVHFGAEGAGSIPERADLALIVCALLLIASFAYLRFSFADRESFLIGGPVAGLALLVASIPFISSGHLGVPGIGVNNDMAAHLIFADWLQNPTGPVPGGVAFGYPIGPHGMVATIAEGLGTEPLYGFLGLLLAITVITALTSLNLLAELPPVRRTLAAVLVSVPYLAASTFGIGGFKEMMVGLFLLTFALILRELPRAEKGQLALIGALAVLSAAAISAYSYPGLAWLAGTAGIWAIAELVLAYRHGRMDEVRAGIRKARPLILIGLVILIVLAIAELPRIKGFIDEGAPSTLLETDSKLRYPVPAPEAFGVWPSGEWLFGYGELGLDAWQLFAAIGLVAFGFAAWWWLRRGDVALPAAVATSALLYFWTLFGAGLYVEAKSLQVPAALIMLFILGALLLPSVQRRRGAGPADQEPEPGPPGSAREGIGLRALIAVPFIALAAYSSFLALRDAVIAPRDRLDELEAFRAETAGKPVLDLSSDRYFDYYLRGAEVRSPAKNAEDKFSGREGKDQRLPVDFDSVYANDMNLFDYAVTTDADYQSGAPPNWEEVDRTDSYVLWKRSGPTPFVGVLAEEARPGRVMRCKREKFKRILERRGPAVTWPRPVIAKRLNWVVEGEELDIVPGEGVSASAEIAPGESATQTIVLPPGTWDLSMQYATEVVPLEVQVGEDTFGMPPGVEGAIPFRPDEGPFWPVGQVTSEGGPVEITVTAEEPSAIQRLLGVDAPAALGNIAATRLSDIRVASIQDSCYRYMDHYYLGAPGALQVGKAGGGEPAKLFPER